LDRDMLIVNRNLLEGSRPSLPWRTTDLFSKLCC
jgi:hypothetical protein